jgi:hypothetical protein
MYYQQVGMKNSDAGVFRAKGRFRRMLVSYVRSFIGGLIMKTVTRLSHLMVVGALAVAAVFAFGDELMVRLNGDSEVPPVKTMASGTGTISIKPDMSVSGGVTTTGVTATMAHIHQGGAGVNGPVLIGLVKSGDNAWAVPDGAKLTETQYRAYRAGELYVNVHSAEHKGGEIRGQLNPR